MSEFESEFPWIGTTTRSTVKNTRATREDEITARAFLLARLGYPKKQAEQRLRANLSWEYERLGRANASKRVASLVTEAYRRAGSAPRRKKT